MLITVKLPKTIHQTMLKQIISDEYGMRGKSLWIVEAIERFLILPNYPELVDIATELEELSNVISIRVTNEFLDKIDKAVICIRKEYPLIEGVKSKIVRASIFQRLIRS